MIAFIHIEKAAGSTMDQVLRQSFGCRHCDIEGWRHDWSVHDDLITADDLRRSRWLYWRLQSIAGHGIKPVSDLEAACPGISYYTMLREPLARCASHYQYQVQVMGQRLHFEEWIKDERYRDFQVRKIAGKPDLNLAMQLLSDRVRFVGLVERFDESLVMMKRDFDHLPLKINYRRRNVASDSSISRALLADATSKELLAEANRLDSKLHAWVVENLYPKQVAEYGPSLHRDVEMFREANRGGLFSVKEFCSKVKRKLIYVPAVRAYSMFA